MEPIRIEEAKNNDVAITSRLYPPEYRGHLQRLLISSEEIDSRVQVLAEMIAKDYSGERPVLVCTLKGACPFFSDVCRALQKLRQGYDIEFVRASSYRGTSSTGTVSFVGELQLESLKGRHVIILEDIVDTGTTLSGLVPMLKEKGETATIEVCTLLDKRLAEKKFQAKYCGFSIPDSFVIGYGLDYNELYRDLADIFVISQQGIDFDASVLHS